MHSRRQLLCLILVMVLVTLTVRADGEKAPATPSPLAIAAASDLKFALDELVATFRQKRPDVAVTVTYGSSGNFYAQLSNRAPFDMFFSADISYPQKLAAQQLTWPGSQFLYGQGRIVVWVPKDSPLDVQSKGLKALLEPSVRRIAIANPVHAPYGRAAEAALKGQGIYDQVKGKLVLGENVSQAAQFVQSGAAEVGIVALSLALSPPMRATGRHWLVPESAHPRLEQAAVTLKWVRVPQAAEAFRAFVTGSTGRGILQKYGFVLPGL